jgi:predicted nucleotide-binding protein
MYTLFVTQIAAQQASGSFVLEQDRFLEYTSERISVPLRGLSHEAIECLRAWPCLLMEEGRTEKVVRVVRISDVCAKKGKIHITVEPVADGPELTNAALFKLRTELDIGEFEFSRNHWAVKDRDLLEVLDKAGKRIGRAVHRQYEARPLPILPSRAELIALREPMAKLSHSDIDKLLLEAGVAGLDAGRDLGGRKSRAEAIVEFAVNHPLAITAENGLFSRFLVSRTFPVAPAAEVESAAPKGIETPTAIKSEGRSPNRVFVVHGRNEPARVAVVTFLQSVGLIGIVLHDKPNMGRHLLTKFIHEAELVTFAVVLMTDDDIGSAKDGRPAPRARQNVILELGYFLAYLGQPRVCALISPGLETPSDFDGIVYIRIGTDERWKEELLRELKAAGMPVAEG